MDHVDGIDETPADAPGWDTPTDIDGIDRTPLPTSDGRAPAAVWAFVDAVAESLQVPRDLVFLLVLSILSTASGGRWRVHVRADWRETLALYTVAAMPSGSLKSATVAAAAAPLYELEDELTETLRDEISQAQARKDLRLAAVDRLKRKGADEDAVMEAIKAANEINPPVAPQLLADDIPPEKLAMAMAAQGGRMGIVSSEGGLFGMLAGRYSGEPNLDLVLKAFSGDRSRSDRVTRDTVQLREPFLAIGVSPQPGVLATIPASGTFRDSGLLARFLYALPKTLLGHRKLDPDPVPDHVRAAYHNQVKALARTAYEKTDTTELELTPAAIDRVQQFRAENEPRLDIEVGDLADIHDWGSKLPGALVRIAALFTLIDNPHATEVDEPAMTDALDLAPYLIDQAHAAFDLINGRHARTSHPRAVLNWIRRKKLTDFTVRQARRDLAGQDWAKNVEAVRDAIADLEDLGWIRAPTPDPNPDRGPGRHPSPRYQVNPAAHRPRGRVLSIPSTQTRPSTDAA